MKRNRNRTLNELARMKGNKKKYVVWSLSKRAREEVADIYVVEDYLYRVKTKHLKDISKIKNQKLVEQHMAFKQNKKTIVQLLEEQDKEDYSIYGVRFFPVKSIIRF